MLIRNISILNQRRFLLDIVLRIVSWYDQQSMWLDSLMISLHSCIYTFGRCYNHNCHLDIIIHKCLYLLMCLHSKMNEFSCSVIHIKMSIYQQSEELCIVDGILYWQEHQHSIHRDIIVHIWNSSDHPIVTSRLDIVEHKFEFCCQQNINYPHNKKRTYI